MRVLTWLGASVVLSCVLGACGKTSGGSSGSEHEDFSDVTRQTIAPRAAQIICESFGTCCENAMHSFDVPGCTTSLGKELETELGDEQSPKSVFDPAAAARCLTDLRDNARCGQPEHSDTCEHIFAGTVAPGGVCTDSNDCKAPEGGDAYCEHGLQGDVSSEQGVCTVQQPPERAKLGDACSLTCSDTFCEESPAPAAGGPAPTSNAACYRADGLFCDADYKCRGLLPLGTVCEASDECMGDSFCDPQQSVCSERKPNGASCESDSQCVGRDCAYGVCRELTPSADLCASGSPFK
ncbi:MAG TPA: hypothetical protein VHB79_26300 [Polyangiaceae bacterium]|nr:hypothetical protein [Polyangiaceae bacterium]